MHGIFLPPNNMFPRDLDSRGYLDKRNGIFGVMGMNLGVSEAAVANQSAIRNPKLNGAGSRIRTDDLLITNQLLYQLSYAGVYLRNHIAARSRRLSKFIPRFPPFC
jgi:hypothetical protein